MDNPKQILVIEDEASLLEAIQTKLKKEGFKTVVARDGNKAIDYLNQSAQLPDLIWLDYYLPKLNGLQILEIIKAKESLKDIPIIVVSNTAGQEKVDAMMALGVDNYFVKAEKRLDEVVKEVKRLLK